MKQPRNRRGLPLQRNDECNFSHVDFSIGRVRRLLSLGIICKGSLSCIASRNILTCLHSLCANTHNTYNDFHWQFQLGKLVSPFLSCTGIAIRHPETVSTYMLFFSLATSSALRPFNWHKIMYSLQRTLKSRLSEKKSRYFLQSEWEFSLGKERIEGECLRCHTSWVKITDLGTLYILVIRRKRQGTTDSFCMERATLYGSTLRPSRYKMTRRKQLFCITWEEIKESEVCWSASNKMHFIYMYIYFI